MHYINRMTLPKVRADCISSKLLLEKGGDLILVGLQINLRGRRVHGNIIDQ